MWSRHPTLLHLLANQKPSNTYLKTIITDQSGHFADVDNRIWRGRSGRFNIGLICNEAVPRRCTKHSNSNNNCLKKKVVVALQMNIFE